MKDRPGAGRGPDPSGLEKVGRAELVASQFDGLGVEPSERPPRCARVRLQSARVPPVSGAMSTVQSASAAWRATFVACVLATNPKAVLQGLDSSGRRASRGMTTLTPGTLAKSDASVRRIAPFGRPGGWQV